MEITGSELTTVQTLPARLRGRLISKVPRTPVFRAQVNGAVVVDASTSSITDILYDNVTPGDDYLDIRAGMTIDIGTTPGGRERGSLRVRGITLGQIAVQETSPGMIDINDNDYITVVEEYLPWLIPVRRIETLNAAGITVDFVEYHDYSQIYINQNVAMPPKANIVAGAADDGQGYYLVKLADWADAGETYRTVTLSAVASQALAYGATITSYLWDIGDCTLVSGLLTGATITVEVPVGFRYIRLLVGDSNSQGHFMYLPLWTHDATYLPLTDFKITGDDTEDGRSMRFEFYGADSSASMSVLPRNSTIYYWKTATFGREAAAAPRQYRQGALLWVLSDATPLRHKRRGTYTITAGGAADWMKSVYGFPQKIMNPGDTPNTWYEMTRITGTRLLHYVLTTYTTLPNIVNVFYPALTDEIEEFNTKAGTVWSQVVDIAKRCGYQGIGCDSQSGIWMKADYFFLNSSGRAARSRTLSLTPEHWPAEDPPVIPDEQTEDVGQVVGYGAAFDPSITDGEKNALYGARSPGVTHNAGKSRDTAPYQILPLTNSATTLARWTGEYFARKNNRRKQVRVKLIHNLDVIEPCWNEPIEITDTRGNLRGLVLNGDEFIVKKVSIRHNYEPRRPQEEITLTLEGVTTGNGGISFYIPPPTITTQQPIVNYNPPPTTIRQGANGLSLSIDRIAAFDTLNQLHIVSGLRQMVNGIVPTTQTHELFASGAIWAHTFDFETAASLLGWTTNDGGALGAEGVHSTSYSANPVIARVVLDRTVTFAPGSAITGFSLTYTQHGTVSGYRDTYLFSPSGDTSNLAAGDVTRRTVTGSVSWSTSGTYTIYVAEQLYTTGAYSRVHSVTFSGTGADPFDEDAAPTGTLASFAVRADSPLYLSGTGAVNGYLATTGQAFSINDIFSARTLGAPYAFTRGAADTPSQVQLQTERGNPDWALVAVYHDATGTHLYRTSNGAVSWATESSLPNQVDSPPRSPGLWMNPNGAGTALVSASNTAGTADFWQTTDFGATWTKITDYAPADPAECIVKPYSRGDVLFHGPALQRVISGTQITVTAPEDVGHTDHRQRAISIADDDPNAVILVGEDGGVYQAFDGLNSAPTWTTLVTSGGPWLGVYYASVHVAFLIGTSGWIGILKYAAGTWQLYSYQIPGGGTIVGICGG